MKPTTAISFLAFAYAATVLAVPTPSNPEVVAASGQGSADLERRFGWGPHKIAPGISPNRRDVDDVEVTDDQESEDGLVKRFGWGPHKIAPGISPNRKRDSDASEGKGSGYGHEGSNEGNQAETHPHAGRPYHGQKQGGQRQEGGNDGGKALST